jgi:hydrogenase maturation protease
VSLDRPTDTSTAPDPPAAPQAAAPGPVRTVLLACGEPERGDDGAALAAVAALPPLVAGRVAIVRCGQLEVDHLLAVPDGAVCVVVDAAVGVAAGEVVVIPLADLADRAGRGAPRSSHALPPDQVVSLAAALRGRPPDGVFVGIGGRAFGLGAGLSPEVAAGMPAFVERLVDVILRLRGGRPA